MISLLTNDFQDRLSEENGQSGLYALEIDTVQVNIGLKCDLACSHCHVVSSPRRTEEMSWETMTQVIQAAERIPARVVDITGGAPELNPNFRRFVTELRSRNFHVLVRTNLTVFFEPGNADMPKFYRDQGVHLVASLPCYLKENVDLQRGDGVYIKSIEAIKQLNALGYGEDPLLPLDLIYNPIGPALPPSQSKLEEDYRRELRERFGITFTRLLTITNMPIGRFWGDLKRNGQHHGYAQLLRGSFNPQTLPGLMCRHQISVRWDGTLFDCDFNLALKMPVDAGLPTHIKDFDPDRFSQRTIVTANHCFGCTAGCGSSCGGALVMEETPAATSATRADD